ncbi:MAG: D-alanyl-D-alanine carboxypeptidase [Verrucomicrobiae bacterium]|nr:D-alanyl-D-alanine carboxypeptidase [Verrucomicrobiae bacterium]
MEPELSDLELSKIILEESSSPTSRRRVLGGLFTATGSLFLGGCGTDSNLPTAANRPSANYPAPPAPAPPASQPVLANYPDNNPGFFNSGFDPKTQPPSVTAKAAIVVQANTGKVLYARNADTKRAAASTQKLLMALLIAERGGLNQNVTVQASDTYCEPTKMGIQSGQVYQRGYLLRTVLIRSSNDIARCLARDHSGSESAFAAAMTRRAKQLGMNNSYFTNSNGLPSPPGQYSTARDLSILAAACMRHSAIRDAVKTRSTTFEFSNGKTVPVTNTNKVLGTFPYCTGMKTGYTNAAGRCLVSSASYQGRNVIAVILGSQTPQVWSESQALLKWGLGV